MATLVKVALISLVTVIGGSDSFGNPNGRALRVISASHRRRSCKWPELRGSGRYVRAVSDRIASIRERSKQGGTPMDHFRRPNAKCAYCSKAIYRRPVEIGRRSVYCSAACFGKSCRKEKPCPACGRTILASEKRRSCSRACANRLRTGIKYGTGARKDIVSTVRYLKARLIELRGPACERCGYCRVQILVVHHVDRDRKNNKMENLELICPNCHAEEHYGEPPARRSAPIEAKVTTIKEK